MQVFARFRLPDDRLVDAAPGDILGRLPTAAVRLNDPRISEAHALVSLRGRTLRLLALRGRFAVAGGVTSDLNALAWPVRNDSATHVALALPDGARLGFFLR